MSERRFLIPSFFFSSNSHFLQSTIYDVRSRDAACAGSSAW